MLLGLVLVFAGSALRCIFMLHCKPIPRRCRQELTYGSFLREYAIPGLPVIITGFGADWPAKTQWSSLEGLEARGIDMSEVVQVQLGKDGVLTMPLGECFAKFRERIGPTGSKRKQREASPEDQGLRSKRAAVAAPAAAPSLSSGPQARLSSLAAASGPMYLRNWRFHERNPQMLADFVCPDLFALDFAVEAGLIQPNSFTWLYIGESGSCTPTHIDIMNTSAWMCEHLVAPTVCCLNQC